MICGEGLAGAGVEPDFGPVLGPVSGGVGGGIGGEDSFVELEVGDFEPGGALVVEVAEGAPASSLGFRLVMLGRLRLQ